MRRSPPSGDWSRLSAFIADAMGLHFPEERWPDLQRGLAGAAVEFGFKDIAACVTWLLAAPITQEQLDVLAAHLTIGETYFFRDQRAFEIVAGEILPALIHARRGREQRLRIWSAACCSGEEAYSLAILLHRALPDWKDWPVTILATDINPRFLQKAVAGVYGEWSFRSAPKDLKDRYFVRRGDRNYEVIPEIKSMVTFAHLNLVDDNYPSLATDTNAMDLIFCRNVLMYFSPRQIQRVVASLHRCLIEGGRLAVSPSEASQALFSNFTVQNFPGAVFYQKNSPKIQERQKSHLQDNGIARSAALRDVAIARQVTPQRTPPAGRRQKNPPQESPLQEATALYEKGHYAAVSDLLLPWQDTVRQDSQLLSLLARALANQGKLVEALTWCDHWIASDKVDPVGHYLRAIILLEKGDPVEAGRSLQRTIYLSPTFVLPHFALGNLARNKGRADEASKHFDNARQLLTRLKSDDLLPESDGLTAGRLTETIRALSGSEITR